MKSTGARLAESLCIIRLPAWEHQICNSLETYGLNIRLCGNTSSDAGRWAQPDTLLLCLVAVTASLLLPDPAGGCSLWLGAAATTGGQENTATTQRNHTAENCNPGLCSELLQQSQWHGTARPKAGGIKKEGSHNLTAVCINMMNTLGILLEDGARGSYHSLRPPVLGIQISMRTSLESFTELCCAARNSHRETTASHLHFMNSCK